MPTASPDYYFPATASLIGERIGAGCAAGFDLSAACTGFIYALAQGYAQIGSGLADTVLVVGTEVFPRLLDWSDRSTCVLFGDGAGAVILQVAAAPACAGSTSGRTAAARRCSRSPLPATRPSRPSRPTSR